jgi:hypothetical protein
MVGCYRLRVWTYTFINLLFLFLLSLHPGRFIVSHGEYYEGLMRNQTLLFIELL